MNRKTGAPLAIGLLLTACDGDATSRPPASECSRRCVGEGGAGEPPASAGSSAAGTPSSAAGDGGAEGAVGGTASGGSAGGGEGGDDGVFCEPLQCKSESPCQVARCERGECLREPAPDGTPCCDEDPCTTADQCEAGVCVGTAQPSVPKVVARAPLFGGYRSEEPGLLQGLSLALSPEYLLFADRTVRGAGPTALTLVRANAQGLEVAQRVTSPLPIQPQLSGSLDWTFRLAAGLVRLAPSRFAFVAADEGIEVYDVDGDELRLASTLAQPFHNPYDMKADAENVWTCGPLLQRFAVSSAGHLSRLADVPVACQGLALSPDGRRAFVASSQGLSAVSLEAETPEVVGTEPSIGRLNSLSASNQYLAGIEVLTAGEPGDLLLLDANDLTVRATLEGSFGAAPIGVTLVEERLVVVWRRREGSDCRITLERYRIAESALLPLDAALLRQSPCNDTSSAGYNNVVAPLHGDGWFVVQPWRSVLRDVNGALEFATGPQQGAVEQLVAVGHGVASLDGVGPDSVHRFELRGSALSAVAGGQALAPALGRLRVVTGGVAPLLANVSEGAAALSLTSESNWLGRVDLEPDALPKEAVGLLLDAGPREAGVQVRLQMANGSLFLVQADASGYRLKRFGASSGLLGPPRTALASDADYVLPVPKSSTFERRLSWSAGVASDGAHLALFEHRTNADATSEERRVSLLALGAEATDVVASAPVTALLPPAIAKGKLLVVSDQAIQLRELDAALTPLAERTHAREVRRVLRWDGERAYLATLEWRQQAPVAGVWVLSGHDLGEVAFYEVPDEVLSVTPHDINLWLAMKTGVMVVTPACP